MNCGTDFIEANEKMEDNNYKPVSFGNWLLTQFLICIPIVNIILLLVWAFGSNTPISKANWAKAKLFCYLFIFLFAIFFGTVSGVFFPYFNFFAHSIYF